MVAFRQKQGEMLRKDSSGVFRPELPERLPIEKIRWYFDRKNRGELSGMQRIWNRLGPLIGLILILIIFGALEPDKFLSARNIGNVIAQTVVVATAAVGMTFIIISGGIDLSVGSLIALTGVSGAMMMVSTLGGGSIFLGVLIAMLVGLVGGLFNGGVVTLAGLPPFIVTLGTLEIFRGTALQLTNGLPVTNLPRDFAVLANATQEIDLGFTVIVLPYSFYFLVALGGIAWFVLRYTVFGVAVYAVGSNERTARLCGIRVNRVKCAVYMIGGLTAGLAGILQSSRLITGQSTTAQGLELDVIAAVVIGGGSLLGGEGSILGSIVGAWIMGFLRNGCNVVGISAFVQRIIIGAIIILAVFVDQLRHRTDLFERFRRRPTKQESAAR
jgi:ribose transport system permease protein